MELRSDTDDLMRFRSVLEAVRTVPFSGEFRPDGSIRDPYTGPGVGRLLGGDVPEGMDGGLFWGTRVLAEDRAVYDAGAALQRRGEACEMEYRVRTLDDRVLWFRECSRGSRSEDGVVGVDGIVIDVTERRELSDALEDARHIAHGRLESVLASLDEYLYAWRYPPGRPAVIDYESIPQATFLRQISLGGTAEDEWLRTVHPDDRDATYEEVIVMQASGVSGSGEYRMLDSEGGLRWLLDRWTCRREPGGDVLAEGIVTDITDLRLARDGMAAALAEARVAHDELDEARLAAERASNTDPLTGLANRRSFQRSLEMAVVTAPAEPFGLILLDVDHFKRINDTHGHQAGDDVLVAVVERMRSSCPPGALLGALGRRGVHRPRAARDDPRGAARGRRRHPRCGARRAPGDATGPAGRDDLMRRGALLERPRHRRARARSRCGDVPREADGARSHAAVR